MELEEKFYQAISSSTCSTDFVLTESIQIASKKSEKIAEEFAVGFAEWIKDEKYHIDIDRNLWRKYITFPCKTTDELLELYKQSLKQSNNGK